MKSYFLSKLLKLTTVSMCVISIPMSGYAEHHAPATTGTELKKTLATDTKKQQFTFVAKKLNELRLPKELALIPVIESHYNRFAMSPKGAGGLWQLMPGTAKEYGINSKERFQLEASTIAALNYFNVLHKKFRNWEFAIAAYNAGSGRVQKALNKNPSATTVAQLSLPQETKQYVQKFYRMQAELETFSV